MSEHTPGPWRVGWPRDKSEDSGRYILSARKRKGQHTVVVSGGSDDWGVTQGVRNPADARLIAAAPDLLEALERLLDDVDGVKGSEQATAEARAAVAKARGQS